MNFILPKFREPDFSLKKFISAPAIKTQLVVADGVAPDNYHATSIYPEYYKVKDNWILARESRMDCLAVLRDEGIIEVVEFRNLVARDRVVLGRSENCEEGIFVLVDPFSLLEEEVEQNFSFRGGRSRESSYSMDYDNLYDLLKYEKEEGYIVWVLGPAAVFDYDSKIAMEKLIRNGYVDVIFAGNALATHDLEGSILKTALGQDIYNQKVVFNGHYNHIDVINKVRRAGSIEKFLQEENIHNGVIYSCVNNNVPFVLAGSIRDDGPLPEVISDAYKAQDKMREHLKKATTVICLATMLHTIATGNMLPIYKIEEWGIRPVYFYTVDVSEFAVNKLRDRGSLEVTSIVTNVQDFLVNISNNLTKEMD